MVLAGVAIAIAAAQGALTLAVTTGTFAAFALVTALVLVWVGRYFESL